jgi:outer membrane lipoprotein-sorting protein
MLMRAARTTLSFSLKRLVAVACTGVATLGVLTGAALAQQDKKALPPNPAGAQWATTVQGPPTDTGTTLDDKQLAAVRRVSNYFAELNTLRGNFVQTNPDQRRVRGRFAIKKPGRFRFDYAAPSKQVIVSDGKLLAIQDHDLEIDRTVFRILLRPDVDLVRDARILDVQEAEDLIVITLQDKSPDSPGKIRLFLAKVGPNKASLELKEWITTDGQGLDTRVEVSNLSTTEPVDDAIFKREVLKQAPNQQ